MKKAFTLLELVVIIVIIGVITAIIIPNPQSTKLSEAATQVVSHIKYAQHLALLDNRFDEKTKEWYKERWQIVFTNGSQGSDGYIAYAVFSDNTGLKTGHPELKELAKDPLSRDVITGGVTNVVKYNDDEVFSKANIGKYYGVDKITFSSSCKSHGSMRIVFDHLGRPIKGNISSPSVKTNASSIKMINSKCNITLFSGSNSVNIIIEPETGYTYIE